jgi:PAS domain S-box-containing protein
MLLTAWGGNSALPVKTKVPQILIIHSYHPGFEWTESVHRGMMQALQKRDIPMDIHTEYMDSKVGAHPALFEILQTLYRQKYAQQQFDVILVSDNNAFNFMRQYRQDLFPDTPVVFCGVNGFDPAMLSGQEEITGIAEDCAYAETIELMLDMHPDLEHIAVIKGATATSQINFNMIKKIMPAYSNRVDFIALDNLPVNILQERLRHLPKHTAILFLDYYEDPHGNRYLLEEALKMVNMTSGSPVYSLWRDKIKRGALGGMIVSGRVQGYQAGEMAARLMEGTAVAEIPVLYPQQYLPLFNWQIMKRFKIPRHALPPGSEILFEPQSYYRANRQLVWSVLCALILETGLILYLIMNISRRRQAQRKLRQSEEQLRHIIEHMPVVLNAFDSNGHIIAWNEECERITGYSAEEMKNRAHALSLLYPDTLNIEGILQKLEDARGDFRDWAWEITCKDGSKRTLLLSNVSRQYPIPGWHTWTVGMDITPLKEAEASLRMHTRFLETLIDTIPHPVFYKDTQGRYTGCNEAFATRIIGLPKQDIIGRNLFELKPQIPLELAETYHKQDLALLGSGGMQVYESKVSCADRQLRDYLFSKAVFPGAFGERGGIIGVMTDVTPQKRHEQELRAARDTAEEASRAKSVFLANMSHELRTPLNAVIGCTDYVLSTPLEAEQRELLELSKSRGNDLVRLINDLLDLARIESGKVKVSLAPVDIQQLVEEVSRNAKDTLKDRPVEFLQAYNKSIPSNLMADRLRLRQILDNLVNNAIKFTESGRITLHLERVTGHVEARFQAHADEIAADTVHEILYFSITDTGVGIPAERQETVFEEFRQADDSSTRPYGGAGLGLAITRRLITLLGGTIWVDSQVNQGSTFHVLLPFSTNMAPAQEEKHVAEKDMPPAGISPSGKHILLVEDDPASCVLTRRLLKKAHHTCTMAGNGQTALEVLERTHVDLILMDLQMPVMNGIETTQEIIRRWGHRRPPIVAITAHAMQDDRIRCEKAGMDGYITKPVTLKSFNETLQRIWDA